MEKGTPRAFIVVSAIIVVAAIFCVAVLMPFRPGSIAKVYFVGPTNDPAGGTSAVFSVTNESDMAVWFSLFPVQVLSAGSWALVNWVYGRSTNLAAHGAARIAVNAVTNGSVWRVPVRWLYAKPHPVEYARNLVVANLYGNWNRLLNSDAPQFFDGLSSESHVVFSPEMQNVSPRSNSPSSLAPR